MDYQSLYAKTVAELRKLAREMQVRLPAGAKKQLMVDLLLEAYDRQSVSPAAPKAPAGSAPAEASDPGKAAEAAPAKEAEPTGAPASTSAPRKRGRPSKAELEARRAAEAAPQAQETSAPKGEAATPPASDKASERPQAGAEGKAMPSAPVTRAAEPRKGGVAKSPEAKSAEAKPAETKALEAKPAEAKPTGIKPIEAKPEPRGSSSQPTEGKPAERKPVEAKPAEAKPAPQAVPEAKGSAEEREAQATPRPAMERPRQGEVRPRVVRREPGDRSRQGYGEGRRGSAPRYVSGGAPEGREMTPHVRRVPEGMARARQEGAAARPGPVQRPQAAEHPTAQPAAAPSEGENRARTGFHAPEYRTVNPAVPELLAGGDCGEGAGVLEIQPDGYGFLRAENYQKGPNDVYISIAQIRRFNLRQGDYVEGKTRPQREGDRYSAILYITRVNGEDPERAAARPRFEDLVPIYPDQRIRLERPGNEDLSLRLVDLLAPIGKGQRGMIVSPPKAGKTTLLKKIANAITANESQAHLIVLLIDERPEEVTDMKRSIQGEVVYSTFDQPPENHAQVSEMVLERAQRLVEMGKDVVVLMDSITRLARAYNLVIAPTGRSLSGGLDPGALFRPKRFFGAARNIENGGSLTVIATALVETGSRMDDIIYEEFKGTGNMELHLDRKLSDRRVFPAVDMVRSGTRREELLLTPEEQAGALKVRRMLGNGRDQEMVEEIIALVARTRNNADLCNRLEGWEARAEREGYTLGK